MGVRRRSMAAVLVAAATGVLAISAIGLWLQAPHALGDAVDGYAVTGLMWTLVFGSIGTLLLRDSPGNRLGPLIAGIGLWLGAGSVAGSLQALVPEGGVAAVACAVVNGLWITVVPAVFLVPILYPDGAPFTPRWRWPARVVTGLIVVTFVGCLVSPEITESSDPRRNVVNPFGVEEFGDLPVALALGAVGVAVVLGLAALVGQVLRARRLEGDARARVGWLVAFFVLDLAALPLSGWPNFAVQTAAALSLGIGVLRHHLFDIQRILSRSVSYALLVSAAMLAALGTAAAMGSLSQVGVLPALAAAVTAVVLASGFTGLQRRVDRWVYGPREDTTVALERLGARLDAAPDPEAVLPQVTTTVRESLHLPFASITLAGEQEPAAADGELTGESVSYPLRYGGQTVARLELGLHRGDVELSSRDARLVTTLAAQAGAAAHSAQVTRDLRRSREQLVTAREEERRSMRRDLHDGLGPALAGMSLGLESLVSGAATEDQANLAATLLAQARQSLDEVRRMARDLRPAPLDELGLAEALRQHGRMAARMSGGRPDVQILVPDQLPELPAAVEVAAFRIAQEAIANTTRHARASECTVEVSVNGALVVSVRDNGCGEPPTGGGTGLRSMRDRADELGGACTVTFQRGHGTTVRAELPLGPA